MVSKGKNMVQIKIAKDVNVIQLKKELSAINGFTVQKTRKLTDEDKLTIHIADIQNKTFKQQQNILLAEMTEKYPERTVLIGQTKINNKQVVLVTVLNENILEEVKEVIHNHKPNSGLVELEI